MLQDSLAEATQVAEERISNIRTVKSFSKEAVEMNAYKQKMERVLSLAMTESLARGAFFGMVLFLCCYTFNVISIKHFTLH